MGTRADFYVGRGKQAEWIGSIAWNGYPEGICLTLSEKEKVAGLNLPMSKRAEFPVGVHLFDAKTEAEFRARVTQFFANREDATLPEQGWPWPWDDSQLTDYSYAFDGGKVWASNFGYGWFDPSTGGYEERCSKKTGERKSAIFPDMSKIKDVTLSERSGLIVTAQRLKRLYRNRFTGIRYYYDPPHLKG